MTEAVYEFPLKEKVRNYLRIEQLLSQLKIGADGDSHALHIYFFEQLFTLLDLFERLDLRNDIVRDLDVHERNLVYWSQHPNIDSDALQNTLQSLIRTRDALKASKKFGTELKDDKFLSAIRQRFAIPGGTCSFDLPNLHFWLHQSTQTQQDAMNGWRQEFDVLSEAIRLTLSFLRERGNFQPLTAANGFYQGIAEDKCELIRVRCATDKGYYPTVSGNKYRYALRFMWFSPTPQQTSAVEEDVDFTMASC